MPDPTQQSEGSASSSDLIAAADALYKPVSDFSTWAVLKVDRKWWDHHVDAFHDARNGLDPALLKRARTLITQFAAVETGALENLYDLDSGFTITAATETAAFAAALEQQESTKRSYIEAQLRAYDYVLDFATGAATIAEAWIRQLHHVVCGEGATYLVKTAAGDQTQALPLGEYKRAPNHVLLPDGRLHSYAPPLLTAQEMARFVEQLQSSVFEHAHPVLQAAYAHYGLVWIHPFADGNGRVSRALASAYFYRDLSIPLLITTERKTRYLAALRRADDGEHQAFVDFVTDCGVETMRLVTDSLKSAQLPSPEDVASQIHGLFRTTGGFSHQDVDAAAYRLLELFSSLLNNRANALFQVDKGGIAFGLSTTQTNGYVLSSSDWRQPLASDGRVLTLRLSTVAPAAAAVNEAFCLEVPRDAKSRDVVRITHDGEPELEVPIADLVSGNLLSVEMRIRVAVERLISRAGRELFRRAEEAKRAAGY